MYRIVVVDGNPVVVENPTEFWDENALLQEWAAQNTLLSFPNMGADEKGAVQFKPINDKGFLDRLRAALESPGRTAGRGN